MEHLHTLINGIDSVKDHLSDKDYLELMNAVGKLGELINDTKSVSDLESVSDDSDDDNDDNNENDDNDIDIDIDIIDIDLLLKTIDENEIYFKNYINEKNLPEDFINSKFNIINKNSYFYVSNKTCNCKEEDDLCDATIIMSCKNYQKIILKYPLYHIVTRDCSNCANVICNEINKYNLFSFDGSIKTSNNTNGEKFSKYASYLMNMINHSDALNKVLLFINFFSYIFENGHLLLENEKMKEACCNKLLTEGNNETISEHLPHWSQLLNFEPNIINIMINNLIELN
jgi:hypothetical protein